MRAPPGDTPGQAGEAAAPQDEGYKPVLCRAAGADDRDGGAIGVGVFYRTGAKLPQNGPGLVPAFALAVILVCFVLRVIGIWPLPPDCGQLRGVHAREFIVPWAGYVSGWMY